MQSSVGRRDAARTNFVRSSLSSSLAMPSDTSNDAGRSPTVVDAYNQGALLQYMLDASFAWCSQDSTESGYEKNWQGHQPLSPDTWSSSSADDDAEQRSMRTRRRRGVKTKTPIDMPIPAHVEMLQQNFHVK